MAALTALASRYLCGLLGYVALFTLVFEFSPLFAQTDPGDDIYSGQTTAGYHQQFCFETLPDYIPLQPVAFGCGVDDCCPGCPVVTAPWDQGLEVGLSLAIEGSFAESVFLIIQDQDTPMFVGTDFTEIEVPIGHAGALTITPTVKVKPDILNARTRGLASLDDMPRTLRISFRSYNKDDGETFGEYTYLLELAPCRMLDFSDDVCKDKVNFIKDGAGTVTDPFSTVLLIDGRTDFGCLNDVVFRGPNPVVTGSFLESSHCSNEMIAFTLGHAPLILNDLAWDDSTGQTLNLDPGIIPGSAQLPLNIVLANNSATTAEAQLAVASTIFKNHYGMISLESAAIQQLESIPYDGNQTLIEKVESIADELWNKNPDCSEAADLIAPFTQNPALKFDTRSLNVYYVDDPDDMTGLHVPNCNDSSAGIIFIGPFAAPGTLAHEIGHALSLDHAGYWLRVSNCDGKLENECRSVTRDGVTRFYERRWWDYNRDGLSDLGSLNLMFPYEEGIIPRTELTEGQLIRTVINNSSFLSSSASGAIRRDCKDRTISDDCPWIGLNPPNLPEDSP